MKVVGEERNMILTTKALKVQLRETKEPLKDFGVHQFTNQELESYKRKQYFICYIGSDADKNSYKAQINELMTHLQGTSNFLYLSGLNQQMTYEDSQKCSKVYEAWQKIDEAQVSKLYEVEFPIHFKSDQLELTQKVAFTKVMDKYKEIMPYSNATMIKNFGVKLLYWSNFYLPKLYGSDERVLPKVIYGGTIKKQELLFLYYLSLVGCDVLYINPNEDICKVYPECERFSTVYRGKYQYPIEMLDEFLDHMNLKSKTRQAVGTAQLTEIQRDTVPIENASKEEKLRSNGQIENTLSGERQGSATPIGNLPGGKIQRSTVETGNKQRELSYEELAKLATSVVMIEVKDQTGRSYASGSGVVINQKGYILTNFHVVREGALFGIKFENDEQVYETNSIIKYHTDYDLAIIKVDRVCKPLEVYKGEQVVRGQKVVALLNMYGKLIGISSAGFDEGQNLNLAVDYKTIERFAGNYIF